LLYLSLIACIFMPWDWRWRNSGPEPNAVGLTSYLASSPVGGFLLALFETFQSQDAVFRVPDSWASP